jgi:hypothetical protein
MNLVAARSAIGAVQEERMDFSAQLDALQQRVAEAESAAQAAATESCEQLRRRINQAQVDMDQAAKDAQRQAGPAAADAADAIDFAAWTVDNARLAVLDAIDARAYADERAKQAGA